MEDILEGQHRCVRRAYAGAVLGSIMGIFAGISSAVQTHGAKRLLSSVAADPVMRNMVLRQGGQSIAFLGVWSSLFHGIRCIGDEQRIEDPNNTALAFCASVAPFLPVRAFRRQLPWVLALTALDVYHRQKNKIN